MSKIYNNIAEIVGNTPLLALNNISTKYDARARILGKLESQNPLGSVKDRLALALILDAEEKGLLHKDSIIVEPTSGNTGIGLAALAASRGYRCILTMPDTMSIERRKLLEFFGAEYVLTDGARGTTGAVEKAKQIVEEIPNTIILGQFTNPANPAMHIKTTGPEIWEDTGGNVDIFVAGVGTGGTITGVGAYLRDKQPNIQIIAVEPAASPVLSGKPPAPHKIQGIGPGFVPDILDTRIYDEIITVSNEDAIQTAKELAKTEGLSAGISSGAAVWACLQIACRPENTDKTIVTIIPDTGERYMSTALFL
ncbi:MAG: cysteine synthase A [Defluviitaleaceae bacterium]|nr:cysteine synthase A [Defluviitaleaceae bacterium]